jgi:hypothetical protein
MNRRMPRRPLLAIPGANPDLAVLLPGAGLGEWELLRQRQAGSAGPAERHGLTQQVFASLEVAARQLVPGEPFVLEVPLDLGLIQRFVLPLAEPAEIEEMARIQLEKILPYPAEAVGLAFTEVARGETEVILAVEALHYDRLVMLCEPLTSRGCWPSRVLFHPRAVAASAGETTAFICEEFGKFILGIGEAGRLSFAQGLSGAGPAEIAAELPAVLLGAELEGLPTNFAAVRLDARCEESRGALEVSLGTTVELFDAAAAAIPSGAAVSGDLSPPGWRTERLRIEGLARLKRRVFAVACAYVGLLVLGILALAGLKLRLMWLNSQLAAVRPASEAVQAGDLRHHHPGRGAFADRGRRVHRETQDQARVAQVSPEFRAADDSAQRPRQVPRRRNDLVVIPSFRKSPWPRPNSSPSPSTRSSPRASEPWFSRWLAPYSCSPICSR